MLDKISKGLLVPNTEYYGIGVPTGITIGATKKNKIQDAQITARHKPIAKITPVVPEKNFANVSITTSLLVVVIVWNKRVNSF